MCGLTSATYSRMKLYGYIGTRSRLSGSLLYELKFDRSAAAQADSSNSPKCDKINLRTCTFWGNMLSDLQSWRNSCPSDTWRVLLAELSLGRNIGHELKDLERSRVEGLTHKEYPKRYKHILRQQPHEKNSENFLHNNYIEILWMADRYIWKNWRFEAFLRIPWQLKFSSHTK